MHSRTAKQRITWLKSINSAEGEKFLPDSNWFPSQNSHTSVENLPKKKKKQPTPKPRNASPYFQYLETTKIVVYTKWFICLEINYITVVNFMLIRKSDWYRSLTKYKNTNY